MTSTTEKKEKSLSEFIVIVALVGVMMAVFIKYFLKNEDQFIKAGFANIAQTFNTKVSAVHAQWLMDKQPKVVYLASLNHDKKQVIPVNMAGWIDVKQDRLTCEAIWLIIMEASINTVKFPVSAIEVYATNGDRESDKSNAEYSQCRYVAENGSYFQYNRAKGKVSKVIEQQ